MNIYESIAAIMAEGYAVSKDKRNEQQKFLYRGIDDVMNTFYPLLSKHKVFVVPEVIDHQREERMTAKGGMLIYAILTIRYTFFAEDGTSVSSVVIGEGMDSGDKASNKALAAGMKYALFQVFCIPTEEMRNDDPDRTTPDECVPKDPAPKAEAPDEDKNARYRFHCADCGKMITPYIENGRVKTGIRAIAEQTKNRFGRQLCLECGAIAKEKEEQNA